jgi:tetratricopeptide (TPR) repeat protein
MSADASLIRLIEAADHACGATRLDTAQRLYAKVEERARAASDTSTLVYALHRRGSCLMFLDRFTEALPVLFEAMNNKAPDVNPRYVLSAMDDAVSIARITQPLRLIEKLIAETNQKLVDWGRREWRYMLAIQQSYLHFMRGNFDHAQSLAREALRIFDASDSDHNRPRMSLLFSIAHCAFLNSDDAVLNWTESEAGRTELSSEYCRTDKTAISALAWRLRSPHRKPPLGLVDQAEAALTTGRGTIMTGSISELIRTILLGDRHESAQKYLDELPARSADYLRFSTNILTIDLALARVRSLLGLGRVDDEVGGEPSLPAKTRTSDEAIDHLGKAKRECGGLASIAAKEDARLDTTRYLRLFTLRMTRIENIQNIINS